MSNWKKPIDDTEFNKGLVASLADRPNAKSAYGQGGLSAQALKEWFDKSSTTLKTKLNEVIAALGSDDALSNITVTIDGKTIPAKEWIEGIFVVNVGGEQKTLHKWLNELTLDGISDVETSFDEGTETLTVSAKTNGGENRTDSVQIPITRIVSKMGIVVKTDLTPNLKGNEADKAPSVKAVKDGLDGKIDKPKTEYTQEALLAREADGNYAWYRTSQNEPQENCIPRLTDKATIRTNAPINDLDAANKKYADSMRLVLSVDPLTYVMTVSLLNADGDILSIQKVDLPFEEMVIDGNMSEDEQSIVLTLKNGNEVTFSVASLVSGLVSQETFEKALEDKLDKSSLVTTLKGNDADKAPSVQAVNEGLDLKVNTPQTELYDYTVIGYYKGEVTAFRTCQNIPVASRIPRFTSRKTLMSETPVADLDCANKKYVDDSLAPIGDTLSVTKREVDIIKDSIKEILVGNIYYVVVDTEPSESATVGKHLPENVMSEATVNRLGAIFNYGGRLVDVFKGTGAENAYGESAYGWVVDMNSESGVFNFNMKIFEEGENGSPIPQTQPPKAYVYFEPFTIPSVDDGYRIKITKTGGEHIGGCEVRLCNRADKYSRGWSFYMSDGVLDEELYDNGDQNVTVDCLVFDGAGAMECVFEDYSFTVSIETYEQRIVSYPIPKIISKTDMYGDGGSETIDEIVIPDYIQALDGYGLMYSEEKYNYLDFDNRTFVRVCKKEGDEVVLLDNPETIDVSAYLSENAGDITIAPNGIIATDKSWADASVQIMLHMTYLVKL